MSSPDGTKRRLSIRPRTQLSQIEMAKRMLDSLGVKPEELLTREVQAYPRRSYVSTIDRERHELDLLTGALRDAVTERVLQKKSIIS